MRALLLSAFLMCTFTVWGQSERPHPCGTPPAKDPWLSKFQKAIPQLEKRSDSLIYVPVSLHNVGKDDGTGHFKVSAILQAFCRLNQDFVGTNIQFYIKDTIIYHDRTDWYDHASVVDGAFMMFEANVPNTLNCYVVGNPAGNCGYNLPYAGIALNIGCIGPDDHTWAHEVGHAFSLPHPFLGWEGDVYSYINPTPDRVTYDYTYFKDSLILDTTIIDTAWVEFVERKNCLIAGDGFCDTPPDYLSRRWTCNTGTGASLELQKDPDNVDFYSDGTLYMSYASDVCSNRFSPDQITAMEANIRQKKPYLIDGVPPMDLLNGAVATLLLPENGGTAYFNDAYFTWEAVDGAQGYILQLSRFVDFRSVQEELLTNSNEATIPGLRNGIRYYWRVKAYNQYDACAPFSEGRSFTASDMVNTKNLEGFGTVSVFPNPVAPGSDIHLRFENQSNASAVTIQCHDLLGRLLSERVYRVHNGNNVLQMELDAIQPSGWIIVTLKNVDEQISFKIFVE